LRLILRKNSAHFSLGLMRHVSSVLNFLLVGLSLWTGYSAMEPKRLHHANPDATFCLLVLATMILFSFGSVAYSISGAKQTTLRRPSWRRFSIDWWHDPLQCLFLSCCFTGAMALGAALRLPGAPQIGFWMFMFFVCMFLGLLIGLLLGAGLLSRATREGLTRRCSLYLGIVP
jgi:hypothetical protein